MDHDGAGRHILSRRPRMPNHIDCEGADPLPVAFQCAVTLRHALGIVLLEAI